MGVTMRRRGPYGDVMSEKTVTFGIDGMHCGGCVRRVTGALSGVDGISDVRVEVGTATFVTDDDGIVDEAKAAVTALGFTVTGWQAAT
jgi:copper chaperone CopZ